ncbi:MAG: hypothetical protein ABIF09_10605 [Gemmatimonadota bacterium]
MNYWANLRHVSLDIDDIDIDSGSDTYDFIPGRPIDLVRVGFIATTDVANAASTVTIQVIWRPTAGVNTSEEVKDTFTVTDTTTISRGSGVYRNLDIPVAQATGADGSLVDVGPSGPVRVLPGEALQFKVGNAADSGAGVLFFDYVELPFAGEDELENMSEDVT